MSSRLALAASRLTLRGHFLNNDFICKFKLDYFRGVTNYRSNPFNELSLPLLKYKMVIFMWELRDKPTRKRAGLNLIFLSLDIHFPDKTFPIVIQWKLYAISFSSSRGSANHDKSFRTLSFALNYYIHKFTANVLKYITLLKYTNYLLRLWDLVRFRTSDLLWIRATARFIEYKYSSFIHYL